MKVYELTVKSEMYGETTCVVDIESFRNGRKTFPCGDGTDFTLRSGDIQRVCNALRKGGGALGVYSNIKYQP